jgi:hypothetical protein
MMNLLPIQILFKTRIVKMRVTKTLTCLIVTMVTRKANKKGTKRIQMRRKKNVEKVNMRNRT